MNQVSVIVMPFNGRFALDVEGSENTLGPFASLPLPMPENLTAWADPLSGRPVVMWADGARIQPADFAVVWAAVSQFNSDAVNASAPGVVVMEDVVFEEDPSDAEEDSDGPAIDYSGGFGRP